MEITSKNGVLVSTMTTLSNPSGSNQFIPWTEKERQILVDHYITKGPKWCSSQLDTKRSPRAIAFQGQKMGLKKQAAWSESDLEYLRENYGTLNTQKICNFLKKTMNSVVQMAMKMGVNGVNYKKWSDEEKEILRQHYRTMPFPRLILMLPNHPKGSIKRMARSLKLSRQSKGMDLIQADISVLTNESIETMYWLGFLLADGHFSKSNRLKLLISKKDKTHLERFATFIKFQSPVSYYKNAVYLAVMDKWWVKEIKDKYDISNNKTYNPPNLNKFDHLNNDQVASLIIGFIDGDGCITTRKHTKTCNLSIKTHSSWLPFLDFTACSLERISGLTLKRTRINKQGYAVLAFSNHRLNKCLKMIIQRLRLPVLERKWSKIDEKHINVNEK